MGRAASAGSRDRRQLRVRTARRGNTARRGCSPWAASSSGFHREWRALGLEPIGLHEERHTAATWLDHAGVSPKVASTLMGHKTPEYQPGAASITLRRYTHMLPRELERARDQLDRCLIDRTVAPRQAMS